MADAVAGQGHLVAGHDELGPVVGHGGVVSELAPLVARIHFVGDLDVDPAVAALRRDEVDLLPAGDARPDGPSARHELVVDDRLVERAEQVVHERLLVLDERRIARVDLVVELQRREPDDVEPRDDGRDARLRDGREVVEDHRERNGVAPLLELLLDVPSADVLRGARDDEVEDPFERERIADLAPPDDVAQHDRVEDRFEHHGPLLRRPLREDQREPAPGEIVGERRLRRRGGRAVPFPQEGQDLAEAERHDAEGDGPPAEDAVLVIVEEGAVRTRHEQARPAVFRLDRIDDLRPILDELDFVEQHIVPSARRQKLLQTGVQRRRIPQRTVFQQLETQVGDVVGRRTLRQFVHDHPQDFRLSAAPDTRDDLDLLVVVERADP